MAKGITRDSPEMMLSHVRYNLDRVSEKVLGKKHSDYFMEIYSADQMICDDLIREYESLMKENRMVWVLLGIMFLVALILYGMLRL